MLSGTQGSHSFLKVCMASSRVVMKMERRIVMHLISVYICKDLVSCTCL